MKALILSLSLLLPTACAKAHPDLPQLEPFIDEMVEKHDFDRQHLESVFAEVEVKDSILKAIARPAERAKPWYEYRQIFIQDRRIRGGVIFWQQHHEALAEAEKRYGVPAEIIVSILGVETNYGGNVGGFRVIDALSTLAFQYPPRSKFFRSELENFLILTREEDMSQLDPVGSYAGAMGLGQFMPSSYRHYAVDFDDDGKRDIWENPEDAIGSIANYLAEHGWQPGEPMVHPALTEDEIDESVLDGGLKPSFSRDQLVTAGFDADSMPEGDDELAVIALTQRDGEEYWLGRQNYYAITRYNHSRMYAMAVIQLAEAIRDEYGQD